MYQRLLRDSLAGEGVYTQRTGKELQIRFDDMREYNQACEHSWVYCAIGFGQLRIPLVYSSCYSFSLSS